MYALIIAAGVEVICDVPAYCTGQVLVGFGHWQKLKPHV
jgi:hypothetical protein